MFKKYIKNKHGYVDMITSVPIVILIVLLIVFFLDLASYSQKYLAIRKTADSLLRVISLQGTLNSSVPSYIPGGDKEFWKNSEISNFINDVTSDIGVNNATVTLDIEETFPNGTTLRNINLVNGSTNVRINYASNITIKIRYVYRWSLFGQTSHVGISRTTSTEYKHRNQGWASGD